MADAGAGALRTLPREVAAGPAPAGRSTVEVREVAIKLFDAGSIAPCPFCGYDAPRICFSVVDVRVMCPKCLAHGPLAVTERGAVDWWNTRFEEEKDAEALREDAGRIREDDAGR